MRKALVVANLLGAAVFAMFALFQINDDDPLVYESPSSVDLVLWTAFYALIAVVCLIGAFRRAPIGLLTLAATACLFQMGMTARGLIENVTTREHFTLTGSQMNPGNPEVEKSREFFGALIAMAAVCAVAFQRRSWSPADSNPRAPSGRQ